jgi:hypothetical protein
MDNKINLEILYKERTLVQANNQIIITIKIKIIYKNPKIQSLILYILDFIKLKN